MSTLPDWLLDARPGDTFNEADAVLVREFVWMSPGRFSWDDLERFFTGDGDESVSV